MSPTNVWRREGVGGNSEPRFGSGGRRAATAWRLEAHAMTHSFSACVRLVVPVGPATGPKSSSRANTGQQFPVQSSVMPSPAVDLSLDLGTSFDRFISHHTCTVLFMHIKSDAC
jgi:hypothetical protein